ncbi:hypothetical protein [Verrucomicrobium sp. BvORR106]|uniref:hypothetical protein n=1 Tax=Verrucomicrobium sp. BvORR106 TaxID=1403819 RepID=UPI00224102FA|nr:hypothetical protein [Verrucomicrobium sp. BvORR106]
MNLCFAVSGIGSSLFPLISSGQNPLSGSSGSAATTWLLGIGSLVVALQIVASIGLIRLREWARQTTVILAGLQSLICIGGMAVITGILPLPGAPDTPAPVTSTDPSIQGKLEFLNAVFGTLGTIFKVVLITLFALSLIYSLLQIILLTRPRVRQACL